MHREPLLYLLRSYRPWDDRDARCRDRIVRFIQAESLCFRRSLAVGHITASAWLLDGAGKRVLLTHHRKLGKWVQPGGHADGDPHLSQVALKEAEEESGLSDLVLLERFPFDLDVHLIPARPGEPEHLHYDLRFLVQAQGSTDFQVSDESFDLAWVGLEDLPRFTREPSVPRMAAKWFEASGGGRGELAPEARVVPPGADPNTKKRGCFEDCDTGRTYQIRLTSPRTKGTHRSIP